MKSIAVHVIECYLSDSWIERSIHEKLGQQRNTHFQCGKAWCDGGYSHIVADK